MEQQESMYSCAVPVATIWTSPESVRELDEAGVANPLSMNRWIAAMTLEERFELCKEKRVQSQLIYGEPVLVESIQNGWASIIAVWQRTKKDDRGYPGWVPLAQLKELQPLNDSEGVVRVGVPKCQLWHLDRTPAQLVVPYNTILPMIKKEENWIIVATPDGDHLIRQQDVCVASSVHHFKKCSLSLAAERAMEFLDLPYFWGGMSSYGYDCSGLTYNMFKACGQFISRDASDQATEGEGIPMDDPNVWKRGDLLFFADEQSGNVDHVGFYYGEGQMIHATSTKKGAVELCVLSETSYAKRLCAVRRYSEEAGIL
ncbi:NlpC/P60 family protein [Sporosarcina sp. BI001-red]|uniref:C40 family peptidase n=1 Tax=Sporosarcina sp. BI001-red TaxID=2282866 RepID=UPI000E239257|nr:C40 family peptidase [Sporosarcina sp. BI001-red]REB07985.1 NlpC/P60 family protein [Sporosarcina sp. BI001-red]